MFLKIKLQPRLLQYREAKIGRLHLSKKNDSIGLKLCVQAELFMIQMIFFVGLTCKNFASLNQTSQFGRRNSLEHILSATTDLLGD